jgi:hypothetical protein
VSSAGQGQGGEGGQAEPDELQRHHAHSSHPLIPAKARTQAEFVITR